MSNFINLSPRAMMGAAIVGIVGAAGVFIYEQLYAEKRRAMLGMYLHNLRLTLFRKLQSKFSLMFDALRTLNYTP